MCFKLAAAEAILLWQLECPFTKKSFLFIVIITWPASSSVENLICRRREDYLFCWGCCLFSFLSGTFRTQNLPPSCPSDLHGNTNNGSVFFQEIPWGKSKLSFRQELMLNIEHQLEGSLGCISNIMTSQNILRKSIPLCDCFQPISESMFLCSLRKWVAGKRSNIEIVIFLNESSYIWLKMNKSLLK